MESSGCGCPPTASIGRVHHVFVNVKDLDRARAFYGWLMPRLGYAAVFFADPDGLKLELVHIPGA